MSGIPERFHKERQAQLEQEIMGAYPASKKQRLEDEEEDIHRATPPASSVSPDSVPVRPASSSSSTPTSASPATVAPAPSKTKGTGTIVSAMPVLYSQQQQQQQQQQTVQTSPAPRIPYVPPPGWTPPVAPYLPPTVPPLGMPPTYMPYPPYGFPQAYGAGVPPPYSYGKPPIPPYTPLMYMPPGPASTPYGTQAPVPLPPPPASSPFSSSTTNGATSTVAAIKQDMQSPVQFVDYNNQFTAKGTERAEKQEVASTESAEASVPAKDETESKDDTSEKSKSKQTILVYNDEEVSMEEKRLQLGKYNKT